MSQRVFWLGLVLMVLSWPARADFDHGYACWDGLAREHVHWLPGEVASEVDYAAIAARRGQLQACLDELSSVSRADFERWSKDEQLAFLINAYNAFTVELILQHYPGLESIRDIGGWFKGPWKQRFFSLLGEERTLDEVEHDMIRGSGRYNEPRIHVAVVCASVGCPALRDEAWTAARLEEQLADSLRRFLGDASRNRLRGGTLEVSKIFDWYGEDFPELRAMFAAHAEQLAADEAGRQRLRAGDYSLDYLDYDWALNDHRR